MSRALPPIDADARALYARWSPAVWKSFCDLPAAVLAERLKGRADAEALLSNYLALGREAIGLQYLDLNAFEPDLSIPNTFLAVCWVDVLPRLLPAVHPVQASEIMAKVWNVGERLVREPAWMNRYLIGCVDRLRDLTKFEDWLREMLTPVMDEPPVSQWKGPLRTTVIDCRPHDDAFIPGAIHLAAPAVACVHDIRAEDRRLAILLRADKPSVCLGRTPCLGHAPAKGRVPKVSFKGDQVSVGGAIAALPHFGEVAAVEISPSGFVLAASTTSQRLWVIHSP